MDLYINLDIRMVNGPAFRIQAKRSDSIAEVKEKLQYQFNINSSTQRLVFQGKQLNDHAALLSDYLSPNATEMKVHLITSRITQELQLQVHVLFHKVLGLELSPRDTVGQLKHAVMEREGIDAARQKVVFRGKVVPSYVTLAHLNLHPTDKLYVVVKDI
ncbi:hypothetical protein EON65_57805 [archaeon]|nr:MAG: hypothetical protein EON65_57805 [archaeon]